MKNSTNALRGILLAMTANDLPVIEVTWQAGSPENPISDEVPSELTLRQPGHGPVILVLHDGLKRLADVMKGQSLPQRMRAATIVRSGDTLRITNIR